MVLAEHHHFLAVALILIFIEISFLSELTQIGITLLTIIWLEFLHRILVLDLVDHIQVFQTDSCSLKFGKCVGDVYGPHKA